MASSSASRSSASFSCGSCCVPFTAATPRLYQGAGCRRRMRGRAPLGGDRLRPPTRAAPERNVESDPQREDGHADQLARREVPPGAAGEGPEEVEDAAPLLVSAHRLDQCAQRRVEDEVEREELAVETLARAPQGQREEDAQLAQGLVELRGMDGQRAQRARLDEPGRELALVGERLGREPRGPGEVWIAGRAPAAASGEAAHPPDG